MELKKQYLSAEDFATTFSLSKQYTRSLARRGIIPSEKLGNTWIIDKAIMSDQKFLFSVYPDVKDQKCQLKEDKITALSFFSGAMGLDYGIEQSGINFRLASELDPNARKTILLNHPNIGLIGDIEKYSGDQIREYAGISKTKKIDLMVGGPPCQAFSTAGKREGFNDIRGNVFLTFIERILELKPTIAVIENVRGLLSAPLTHRPHTQRGFGYPPLTPEEEKGGALEYIIALLEKGGYKVSFNLYNSANFGSPQIRERIVIFCTKIKKAPYLVPTHSANGEFNLPKWRTFKEVTNDLKEENLEYLSFPEYRLQYYKMLKAGQYWKNLPADIQKEAMGASYYAGGGKTGFYRRLAWDKPSPTLVTDPTMPATDLAHPVKDRPLSIQEYMRIQEFPDDWKIWGSLKDRYRQIGNAVPISLGKAIGIHIQKLLAGETIKEFANFNYSRYKNTNDVIFHELMLKRKKLNNQLLLDL
ncbi:MAG: DNA cytosine methyltransferase [Treponema sp.]|nr:DNA cytosine methyltransferase [Treponema sp.]